MDGYLYILKSNKTTYITLVVPQILKISLLVSIIVDSLDQQNQKSHGKLYLNKNMIL